MPATSAMPTAAFADQLARFGPERTGPPPSLEEARAYCRRLARTHYENFTVASLLVPRGLRPHMFAVYAYCRWADDLADETGDGARSLALLDWWEAELHRCYEGQADHPVFVALGETIRRFDIPAEPLVDLLIAMRRDQQQSRWATFDELLDYCRYSANPVGRLVLYLGSCCDAARAEIADRICTGLQLVNFWQDVARDWDRGRVYLPEEDRRRFGYDDAALAARQTNDAFRALMAAEVARAEAYLCDGLPLVAMVPRWLRVDVRLFVEGGLATAAAIRRIDYDVWRRRPTVAKWTKLRLVARAWWQARRGGVG